MLRLLDPFHGREEWGVQVYVDETLAARAAERGARESQETAPVSAGAAYFLRKKHQQVAAEQKSVWMSGLAEEIYRRLLPHAVEGRQGRFLNPPPEGPQAPLLSAAFFIPQPGLAAFEDAAALAGNAQRSETLWAAEVPCRFVSVTDTDWSVSATLVTFLTSPCKVKGMVAVNRLPYCCDCAC